MRLPRRPALPRRSEPSRCTVPAGVVPWTGVVPRAQTVVVDARTVVVGARTVTRPRRSFGSRASITYGCLPVDESRAALELVDVISVDVSVVYPQSCTRSDGRLFSGVDVREVSPLNDQGILSVQSSRGKRGSFERAR